MSDLPRLTNRRLDVALAQRVASRCWPLGWHPGGLGWWLRRRTSGGPVVGVPAASGARGLAGFAVIGVHEDTDGMVLADDAEALAQLVRWCREHAVARVHAHLDDDRLLRALAENGYAREENERVESGLLLPVADRHAGDVAEGYRVRPVRDDELAERVDCHRAAWRPADLPRPPGHERAGPDETSSFTRSMYEEVRDTWGYRAELDLVVEAPDGSLAGCCIAWLDERIGVAEIEPLGVVPAHRGRRLASAMCLDAARRIEARGGTTVFINAEPRAEYPAPGRAYLHAGFHTVPRFVRCRLP